MTNLTKVSIIAMVLAAFAAIFFAVWWGNQPGKWEGGKEASEVRGIDKVDVPVTKVKVYAPKAKKALRLPNEVQSNPNQHVVSAIDCGDLTAVTLIDERTGEIEALVQDKPLPWIAKESAWAIRLDHDITRSVQALSVRHDFLQLKALHLGVLGEIDTAREFSARVGVEWRF